MNERTDWYQETEGRLKFTHLNATQAPKRPWLVYVDDVMLRRSNGVGRLFATKEAATKAAKAHLFFPWKP